MTGLHSCGFQGKALSPQLQQLHVSVGGLQDRSELKTDRGRGQQDIDLSKDHKTQVSLSQLHLPGLKS